MEILINDIFCFHNNDIIIIFKSPIYFALCIFHRYLLFIASNCINYKLKFSCSHSTIKCFNSSLIFKEVIKNSRKNKYINRISLRRNIINIYSLILWKLNIIHFIYRFRQFRDFLIQKKISQNIRASTIRQDIQIISFKH